MLAEIYDNDGRIKLSEEDREPVCGEDFCDDCGDCLHCYGGDDCYPHGGQHRWIIYGDKS